MSTDQCFNCKPSFKQIYWSTSNRILFYDAMLDDEDEVLPVLNHIHV